MNEHMLYVRMQEDRRDFVAYCSCGWVGERRSTRDESKDEFTWHARQEARVSCDV